MQVSHGSRTFLAFEDNEEAAGIAIPIAETLKKLTSSPNGRPPYVFFETDRVTFEKEAQQTYPFRTLGPK